MSEKERDAVRFALRWMIEFGIDWVPLMTVLQSSWVLSIFEITPSVRDGWLETMDKGIYPPLYRLTQKALDAIKESKNE